MAVAEEYTIGNKPYKNRISYPNKYLELGSTYWPKNIKELIKLCRKFYYDSPILRNIVNKISEYPISDLIMKVSENSDKEQGVKEKYVQILDEQLRIKNFLLEVGINYTVNGNVIISVNQDFKRQFTCQACNSIVDGETFESFKVKKLKKKLVVHGNKCPKCSVSNAPLEIKDVPLKGPESINIIFWNPMELDVEYNEWNGKKRFLYSIPKSLKNRFLTANGKKDKQFILTLPSIYIDAMEQNLAIELDVYHFGTPELAQDKRGLNIPIVVSVLKDFWYYQTVRRAQEAILSEHVVPFRSIFPQMTGNFDPFTMMRMDKWKATVKDQVEKWKADPNHIMITPIPVGSQSVGGDAKYLLLTNELRLIEETIINGFGAPVELIKGGVSWSGSSVSLRVMENHFLSFRRDLELMINSFILPKVAKILKLPKATVRFSRLRMGDDQQFKQLMFQLVQSGFFSLETFLEELGFDSYGEKTRLEEEAGWFNGVKVLRGKGDAEIQSMQQIMLSRAGVKAQEAVMEETALVQMRQERAAAGGAGGGVATLIQDLAMQFLNLPDKKEAVEFMKQVKNNYGSDVVKQVVEYLETYASQEMNPEAAEEARKQIQEVDSKVDSPPSGKSRKPQETEDRVRASKKTTKA